MHCNNAAYPCTVLPSDLMAFAIVQTFFCHCLILGGFIARLGLTTYPNLSQYTTNGRHDHNVSSLFSPPAGPLSPYITVPFADSSTYCLYIPIQSSSFWSTSMRSSLVTAIVILFVPDLYLVRGLSLSRVVPEVDVDVSHAYRHTGYIDQRVRSDSHAILNHQLYHQRNVDQSSAAPVASPAQRKTITPASNDAAPAVSGPAPACLKALDAMNGQASNPSGIAVCYNVMQMDNTTGVFMADLRLYKIAAPTGNWATLDMKKVSTSLTYLGADVSQAQLTTTKRDELQPPDATGEGIEKRAAAPPRSLQHTIFIGKAHADVVPYLNNV